MSRVWIGLLLAAGCAPPGGGQVPSIDTDVTTEPTNPWVAPDCDDMLPLPLSMSRIGGFTGAEDFAFDVDGNYVATDDFGNILRISYEGEIELWVPGFGTSAGTAFLPNGHLAIADVFGGVVDRVRRNGSTARLFGGLSYPNGLTVDLQGRVYVADQNLGRVFRFDPELDELVVLAEDLYNPNGVALSPDQQTLYVNSFGGGTIHQIDLLADPTEAVLFGETPVGTVVTAGPCDDLLVGDECFLDGFGIGTCVDTGAEVDCLLVLDEAACEGGVVGDPCVTSALGEPVNSVCVQDQGALFCPRVPGEIVTACQGLVPDDPCNAMQVDRTCRTSWEDVLICDVTPWSEVSAEACVGLDEGDECVVVEYEGYTNGTCEDDAGSGVDLDCEPSWDFQAEYGGLDGMAVDGCGYVYVTEYTVGMLWRFPPGGGQPELALETNAYWIPNMHWGSGVGGWDPTTMYVQDRMNDELIAVPIGIVGAPVAYSPQFATED